MPQGLMAAKALGLCSASAILHCLLQPRAAPIPHLWVACEGRPAVLSRPFSPGSNPPVLIASPAGRWPPSLQWFPKTGQPGHCVYGRSLSVMKAVRHLPAALNLLSSEQKEEASAPQVGLPPCSAGCVSPWCCAVLTWCPDLLLSAV